MFNRSQFLIPEILRLDYTVGSITVLKAFNLFQEFGWLRRSARNEARKTIRTHPLSPRFFYFFAPRWESSLRFFALHPNCLNTTKKRLKLLWKNATIWKWTEKRAIVIGRGECSRPMLYKTEAWGSYLVEKTELFMWKQVLSELLIIELHRPENLHE